MKTELQKLEEKLITAILNSDVKIMDYLLHDDMIFVNHLGMVLSKKDDLAPHKSGELKMSDIIVSDQHMHFFGDTCSVVVTKSLTGTYMAQPFESRVKFTRVWKLFNGQWKVITASSVPY